MLVQSFPSIVEQVVGPSKQLTGALTGPDLSDPNVLLSFEAAYPLLYAFLAFHPAVDEAIVQYLSKPDAVADDVGDRIFLLFTLDRQAPTPTEVILPSGGTVKLIAGANPSSVLLRRLFEPKVPPPLPGIVFIRSFQREANVICAELNGLGPAAVGQRLRMLFRVAEDVSNRARNDDGKFASRLGASFTNSGWRYSRTERRSMREWLASSVWWLRENGHDLVTVVGASIGAAGLI